MPSGWPVHWGHPLHGLSARFQNDQGGLLFRSPNATPRRPTWPRPFTRWGFFFCVAIAWLARHAQFRLRLAGFLVVLLLSSAISSKHLLQATARVPRS